MYISLNKNNFEYHPNIFQSIHSIKEDINNQIFKKNNIKIKSSNIILYYKQSVLEDKKTLYHYKIKKNDTIIVKFKEKGGGPTVASIGLLILSIFLTLILIGAIFMGFLPFLSYLISKIIIKGFNIIIDFLRSLTEPNNFLNSFLATIKSVILPIISFILYYGGLVIIFFYMVFFSVYYIYAFIYKDCRAFKAAKTVAQMTTIMLIMFYFLSNLPNLLNTICKKILPSFISGILSKIFEMLSKVRVIIIGAIPYIGVILTSFINVMTTIFGLLNKVKFQGPKFLFEWDKMYKWTLQPEQNQKIKNMGVRKIVDGVEQAAQYEHGKTVGEIPFTQFEFSAFIFIKFLFQTTIYMLIEFVDIFDICGDKPESLIAVEENIKKVKGLISSLEYQLNDPSINPDEKTELRSTLQDLMKSSVKLSIEQEKEEKQKMLDVECLREILINGAFAGVPTVLVFLIFFILMCIPSMVAKMAK